MSKPSISFVPSGYLLFYQLGVAEYMFQNLNIKEGLFYGGSSGSIVALLLSLNIQPKLIMDIIAPKLLNKISNSWISSLFYTTQYIREELLDLIKDYNIQQINNRCFISITTLPFFRNKIISQFKNIQELSDCIIGSCNIPILFSKFPTLYKKNFILDTCFSNLCPTRDKYTIIVGPNKNQLPKSFIDEPDIHAPDDYPLHTFILRPSITQAKQMFHQGMQDSIKYQNVFLEKGWKINL